MNESNVDQVAKALAGFKVVGHRFTEEEFSDEKWGRLLLEGPKGEKAYIEPSRDPEGNGPGFCFFGEDNG